MARFWGALPTPKESRISAFPAVAGCLAITSLEIPDRGSPPDGLG